MSKKRVLSGMQPSGLLHLGNLLGALENWRKLQDQYECYYFIADWHALTTNYADTSKIRTHVNEMVIDWLSTGLDPEKVVLFKQSLVPEHAVLHLLLSMSTPLPWLERVPTYKEKMDQIQDREMNTYGFLGYPVLQAADILIYKAHFVPVGVDQLPHLELTREIGRRFDQLYGEIFPEPQPLMTEYPKLPGTDGRKMSKSYGNTINMSDSPEAITKKVMAMVTDPARVRRNDPGNPDVCPLFALDKIFAPKEWCDHVNVECRRAGIGCVDDKKELLKHLLAYLKPMQERRKELVDDPKRITDIIHEGSRKARVVAAQTLAEVNEAMKL
ncbi:MAG: tryptophan--tRNA ligase [Nitrospirae bacterium GWC2_56_14]|nr:MAG: tryptophan--tRNA ligase [Nitrospirae bacterium GWC2_56_14]